MKTMSNIAVLWQDNDLKCPFFKQAKSVIPDHFKKGEFHIRLDCYGRVDCLTQECYCKHNMSRIVFGFFGSHIY